MKSETCVCDGTLFFHDTQCLRCERAVVRCPVCERVAAVNTDDDGTLHCTTPGCGAVLLHCLNAIQHNVCNGSVVKVEAGQPGFNLCRYCRLNQIIPQLTIPGNLQKWAALEEAKHRTLAGLEQAGFRLEAAAASGAKPLRFQFKRAGREAVTTGHWNGIITIRLDEADSVLREQRRVQFSEAKRTLTDHFRHELGHYVWDWLVRPNRLADSRRIFGNDQVDYGSAIQAYYAGGAPADWMSHHVTAYASSHPWEDFAETFRVYLEMDVALRTAEHFRLLPSIGDTFGERVTNFLRLGVAQNELARDFGFEDFVAGNFAPAVIDKLAFIDTLPALVTETEIALQPPEPVAAA